MSRAHLTRREFATASLAAFVTGALGAQTPVTAHAVVAAMERNRILTGATAALAAPVIILPAAPTGRGSAGEFVSDTPAAQPTFTASQWPPLFRADARALRSTSLQIATLTAAFVLTSKSTYAERAADHLRAWFVTPATTMRPAAPLAGCAPDATGERANQGSSNGIMDLVPLAEIARASSFLAGTAALSAATANAFDQWLSGFATWLGSDRQMLLARDAPDHRASAWLLLRSAIARALRDDAGVEDCRRRFRHPTLRNQIAADGHFPQEVAAPNPYRNSLMNFDLLAGVCQLLNSPFDDEWDYELQDGPGMRAVAAFHFPLIADRNKWPFVSDAEHFLELPGRRPALLFCGRAYSRPEYVQLWKSLPPEAPTNLAGSFPIRQPLLWTERAPHGL